METQNVLVKLDGEWRNPRRTQSFLKMYVTASDGKASALRKQSERVVG